MTTSEAAEMLSNPRDLMDVLDIQPNPHQCHLLRRFQTAVECGQLEIDWHQDTGAVLNAAVMCAIWYMLTHKNHRVLVCSGSLREKQEFMNTAGRFSRRKALGIHRTAWSRLQVRESAGWGISAVSEDPSAMLRYRDDRHLVISLDAGHPSVQAREVEMALLGTGPAHILRLW